MAVILKPGREKSVKGRHHWIFSGAIESISTEVPGSFLPVLSHSGEHLGFGSISPRGSIRVRMLSFSGESPEEAFRRLFREAAKLRKSFFSSKQTNCFRLINGEGDALPGLVVDRYGDLCVIQISSHGMESLRPLLFEELERVGFSTLYERSESSARREEGLPPKKGHLAGKEQVEVEVLENGIKFLVNVAVGQKTGFFLDQRAMRERIEKLSKEARVLNCFSYSGGFSLYALRGGAKEVVSVDISESATELLKRNVELNQFTNSRAVTADVFDFLRKEPLSFDLTILDPPAFAKKRSDIQQAARGYKEINRLVMEKAPSHSLLLTCSCSHFVDETLFKQILFAAAKDAKRAVRVMGRHEMALDHPVNLYHPESDYLKSYLLFIT